MRNIKCVIRNNVKRQDKEHLVYIRYSYNRKFILVRTDLYVLQKNWNKKSGRFRKSHNYELKNEILDKKEHDFERLILELIKEDTEPTLSQVKRRHYSSNIFIESEDGKKIDEKKLLKDFKKFIDDRGREVQASTKKTYNTTHNKLIQFQSQTHYPLFYDNINKEFYINFLKFLRGQALIDNSVDKHIKNLKLFMNWALSKELHNNNIYQTFKRTKTKTDFVVLSEDELKKLYVFYKPSSKKYDEIKDAFIFGCSTGLRYGDLSKVTPGNFHITRHPFTSKIYEKASKSYIQVPIGKTQEYQVIPVNHFICEMIEKYALDSAPTIPFLRFSNQSFNKLIKEVLREAGLTQSVTISKLKDGSFVNTTKSKCDLVSAHTMRRTFISLLASKTEISNIQSVSGHKDIKVLADYIKKSDTELNIVSNVFNSVVFNSSSLNDGEADIISTKIM